VLLDAPQRASVRDDGHPLPGVPLGDRAHRPENPLSVHLVSLAVPWPIADLVPGQPLARPDVDLTQVRVEHDRHAEALAHDLGCVACAAEVARVDGVDALGRELLGERLRLLASARVERHVGVTLPAVLGVPVRLAVANKQQRGHPRLG
jgi:hypothetical protein